MSVTGSIAPPRRASSKTNPRAHSAPMSAGTPRAAPSGAASPAHAAASEAIATPAPAPLVTPRTKGDASGFRRSVCKMAPDTPSAAPAAAAAITASMRNCPRVALGQPTMNVPSSVRTTSNRAATSARVAPHTMASPMSDRFRVTCHLPLASPSLQQWRHPRAARGSGHSPACAHLAPVNQGHQ